jgi:site-specific DNA recombinase
VRAARERLARLEAEGRQQADAAAQERELRLALGGLEEFAARVQDGLADADWLTRREIIRALVKRIEVGRDDIRVVYRVSPPPFANGPDRGTFEHCGRALHDAAPR